MTVLPKSEVKKILTDLGFRVNTDARLTQAVQDFQAGWNLGTALKIDGDPGRLTSAALTLSDNRRKKGLGTLSQHFSFSEFACRCGGSFGDCRRIAGEGQKDNNRHVLRTLVRRLENLRTSYYPKGLSIISGYRCEGWNDHVNGAKSSQHLYGAAADVRPVADKDIIRHNAWFSGIGYDGPSDKVRHVDLRHLSGNNTTKSSVERPAIWDYSK
jgi:zinc D-Ala-D-Ala carboxypeptidase